MNTFHGTKSVSRADLRTLGRKERKVYEAFSEEFYREACYWRVGMLVYDGNGSNMSLHEKMLRIYPPGQRRVDLLYSDKKRVYCVEFKVNISPAAIGQVLVYKQILERRLKTFGDINLVIAGEFCDADVEQYCREHGIVILTYAV